MDIIKKKEMSYMDVAKKVRNEIKKYDYCEPIFVNEIIVAPNRTNARNIAFHRLEKDGIIQKYRKGIYYKEKRTRFGVIGIDKSKIAEKKYILSNNKLIGYITGPTLWNYYGVSTQIANKKWIVTNAVKRNADDSNLNIKLIKPKIKVTDENYKLLQILDMIDQRKLIQDIDITKYKNVLRKQINNMSHNEINNILELSKYYKKDVNTEIINIINKENITVAKYEASCG